MSEGTPNDQNENQMKASSHGKKHPYPLLGGIHSRLAIQLQKSLEAQQASLRSSPPMHEFSMAFQPPSLGSIESVRRQLLQRHSIQKEIERHIRNAFLALTTAQNRILEEIQAVSKIADVTKSFQNLGKRFPVLPQVVAGGLLTNRQITDATNSYIKSKVRHHLDAVTRIGDLAHKDILAKVRKVALAQSEITKQIELIRLSSVPETSLMRHLHDLQVRISTVRLDTLSKLAEQIAAKDLSIPDWKEQDSNRLLLQIDSELATIPESRLLGIEEKLNYIIDWAARQENGTIKRILVAILISILSSMIYDLAS